MNKFFDVETTGSFCSRKLGPSENSMQNHIPISGSCDKCSHHAKPPILTNVTQRLCAHGGDKRRLYAPWWIKSVSSLFLI